MDPRTALTKANIKRAFVRLSEETPLNKINVSTLCKEVGIPRQTFYYHYTSWQELIEDILDDEAIVHVDIFKSQKNDLLETIGKHLDEMDKRRNFHLRLEEAGYESLLIKKMTTCLYDAFADKWLEGIEESNAREAEMNFAFAIAGFYNLILDREGKYEREEIVEFVVKLLRFQRSRLSK